MFKTKILVLALATALTQMVAVPLATGEEYNSVKAWSWRSIVSKNFGNWATSCEYRQLDGTRQERCYIGQVDVYSPRPNFGAAFMYLTPKSRGWNMNLGFEGGTKFKPDGMYVMRGDQRVWSFDPNACIAANKCDLDRLTGAELVLAFAEGGTLHMEFFERNGKARHLKWNLDQFVHALLMFEDQVDERKLRVPTT